MSIKLRSNAVHRLKWVSALDNATMAAQLTFGATTGFSATLPNLLQPLTMAAQMSFVPVSKQARVAIFDAANNAIGFGPAADPLGVFVGTALVAFSDEVAWVTSQPPSGAFITLDVGGRFQWSGATAGVAYTFSGIRRRVSTGIDTPWSKTFTAPSASGDTGQFVPFVRNALPDITINAGGQVVINAYHYIPGTTIQGSTAPISPTYTMTSIPGLSINALTGAVSGIPSGSVGSAEIRCTTSLGTAADVFNLTVVSAPVSAGSIVMTTAITNNVAPPADQPQQAPPFVGPAVNFTTNGAHDWMHWGLGGVTKVNRKANVAPQMTELQNLPAGGPPKGAITGTDTIDWNKITWTDGTPIAARTALQAGMYWDAKPNGYKITVLAGVAPRTLKLYFSGSYELANPPPVSYAIEAALSDNSAPQVVQQYLATWSTVGVLTLVFNAASENQTLTVIVRCIAGAGSVGVAGGNVTISSGLYNMPPLLQAIGNKWGVVGQAMTFTVIGTDLEVGTLALSTVGGLPAGATFVDNGDRTGTFTWTPSGVSTTQVTFKVTDAGALAATQTISIFVAASAPVNPPLGGELKRNGRFFQYNGVPIQLIGGDSSSLAADVNFDYAKILDVYRTVGVNRIRLWVDPYWDPAGLLHPWVYTGNATTGTYDLNKWNTTYWARYRAVCLAARDRGIMVELSITSAYVKGPGWFTDTTVRNAWNKDFNINGAFTVQNNGTFENRWFSLGTYSEVSSPATGKDLPGNMRLIDYQKALIDKLITDLADLPNVFFEVQNEPYAYNVPDTVAGPWLAYIANYIKTKVAAVYPGQTRLVSISVDNASVVNAARLSYGAGADVDILDAHIGLQSTDNPPAFISSQMHGAQLMDKILSQNEGNIGSNYYHNIRTVGNNEYGVSINGPGVDYSTRDMWGWFVSGGFHNIYELMWVHLPGWMETIGARIKAFRDITAQVNFANLRPVDGNGNEYDTTLITAGPAGSNRQVCAEVGQQYVAYFWGTPTGISATFAVPSAGTFTFNWYDPRTGIVLRAGLVVAGGPTSSLIPPPATTDWSGTAGLVLIIKRTA